MSQLQVGGVSTGTGTVALRPPGTNSNRTLILPDYDGNLSLQALIERRTLTGSAQQEVTGIPSWVNQITIDFAGVSGGTNDVLPRIQLGVVGGSYAQSVAGHVLGESAGQASAGVSLAGIGAAIFAGWATTSAASGRVTYSRLVDSGSSSRWVISVNSAHQVAVYTTQGAGYADFVGVVDRLRFTSSGANFTGGQMVVRMEA